ncbi:type VI secretion system Vgr family protein [Rhodosalinus sp.]|uniref:type VI secretion system Vgr family protein n=1 Tax=Rhodosalinus sp. TaxID=2047741 RepID=UPI003565F1F8
MTTGRLVPENFPVRLEGDFAGRQVVPVAAVVRERLCRPTEARLEFITTDRSLDMADLLGVKLDIVIDAPQGGVRAFRGSCVALDFIGDLGPVLHFGAEMRAWPWFLGRTNDCRIFQETTPFDIVKTITGDHGFGRITERLSAGKTARTFRTQYRESDLDFIHRLMEEEGFFYYMDHSAAEEEMVLCDASSAFPRIAGEDRIAYVPRGQATADVGEHVHHWSAVQRSRSGRVTLDDYDFAKPKADLTASSRIAAGTGPHNAYERYDYPGRYRDSADGEHLARVRMEAEAAAHRRWFGIANAYHIATGRCFTLDTPPLDTDATEVLVIEATHHVRQDLEGLGLALDPAGVASRLGLEAEGADPYRVAFTAQPKTVPYRQPATTPRPCVAGLQTAVVTGPEGEEIYPDKYGRIKVRFRWDRLGKADETSSCWVRVMTPSAGSGWGMIHIPRIGQEVVVQFEEGDPDRPIITGMLYNADNMPPYSLPTELNLSGFRSHSTKNGAVDNYNEFVFDDTRGAELVRMQAERDFEQTVKNDARITVGQDAQDKGDMSLTVHNDLTELVEKGNHRFTVDTGNQTETVQGNVTSTVRRGNFIHNVNTGNATHNVKTGNVTYNVETGNVTENVDKGNVTRTVGLGNVTDTIKTGNFTQDVKLGKVTVTAMQSIELKVGGSSVKIDPTGVTIKAPMISLKADAMLQAKSVMTKIDGTAMVMLKGGITLIN